VEKLKWTILGSEVPRASTRVIQAFQVRLVDDRRGDQVPLGSRKRLSGGLATGGRFGIADGELRPIGIQKPPPCM
jgi:hypothetical protein